MNKKVLVLGAVFLVGAAILVWQFAIRGGYESKVDVPKPYAGGDAYVDVVKDESLTMEKEIENRIKEAADPKEAEYERITDQMVEIPKNISKKSFMPIEPAKPVDKVSNDAIKVGQVRNEINNILKIDADVQGVKKESVSQILEIREKAKIHDKIIHSLDSPLPPEEVGLSEDVALYLAQEKLRLIRDETLRNRKILESEQS